MDNVIFVIGQAGTGKTTTVLRSVAKEKSVACLAYTNAAVENLRKRSEEKLDGNLANFFTFKTLHKYFRIGLDEKGNNKIIRNLLKELDDVIVIDEFGLVPFDVYGLVIDYAKEHSDVKFVFIGDILQLSAITTEKDLLIPYDFSVELRSILDKVDGNMLINLITHLSKSLWIDERFRKAKKVLLTDVKRCGVDYFAEIDDAKMFRVDEVEEDDVILSVRKKYLREVGEMLGILSRHEIKSKGLVVPTLLGYVKESEELVSYANGDVIPKKLLTIHKSQGDEYESVIIIVDDIDKYDISSYYTAITRAKSRVKVRYLHSNVDISRIKNSFYFMRDYVNKNLKH